MSVRSSGWLVMAVPLPDCVSLDGPLHVLVLVSSSVSQETQLLQAKAMFLPMDTPFIHFLTNWSCPGSFTPCPCRPLWWFQEGIEIKERGRRKYIYFLAISCFTNFLFSIENGQFLSDHKYSIKDLLKNQQNSSDTHYNTSTSKSTVTQILNFNFRNLMVYSPHRLPKNIT